MLFITVTRAGHGRGQPETTIRADHILQMNGATQEDIETWVLLDKLGWMPVAETQPEILRRIREAERNASIT